MSKMSELHAKLVESLTTIELAYVLLDRIQDVDRNLSDTLAQFIANEERKQRND